MAAPCDLGESAQDRENVKLDAKSGSEQNHISTDSPNIKVKSTVAATGSEAKSLSVQGTASENENQQSTAEEPRLTFENVLLEAAALQASSEASLDSNMQMVTSTRSGGTSENIVIKTTGLHMSSSRNTQGSPEPVLMAAMNPLPLPAVERNFIPAAAGSQLQAPAQNLISESASEESRAFLENVLQAAAEKELRESSQRAMQDNKKEKTADGGRNAASSVSGKGYRVVMEVGIQANDYDIERRSGKLPARQRIIPAKFRDYKNPIDSDEENADSDFEPYSGPDIAPPKKKKTGKRGRPRRETVSMLSDVKEETIEALGRIIKTSTGYKCPRCSKTLTQKGNLKVHMLSHTTVRPFPCDVEGCNKAYRSNESLRRHKLVHMGIKPFQCDECKRTFASNNALKEHFAIHNNTKAYTCEVCSRQFRQVSCFKRHLITHTTNTPFACHICQRRFSQMSYLRSHMKVHTGERPFQCDKCPKAFAHQSDLARHKIIHTGIKPYECSICSAKFSDPSSRRRHYHEHMRTKSFECSFCGEKFKRQSQIRVHMNRWHNGTFRQSIEGDAPQQMEQGQEIHLESAQSLDDASTVVNIMIPDTGDKTSLGEIDVEALANQRKIVSLIQNLNTGFVVQEVEIASPANLNGGENDQSESGTQNVEIIPQKKHHLEIPINDLPTVRSEDGNIEKTLIAIAEVQEDGKGENSAALPVECAYQIIQELAEGGDENQVYEIQYQTSDDKMETSLVQLDSHQPETAHEKDSSAAALSASTVDGVDYVRDPDFASQEYFNWLSNFTELCKVLKMPLNHVLFEKISQVHKSITDFMAKPSGVLNDKENFRVLMSISKDLNNIISNHLAFVMESMDNS